MVAGSSLVPPEWSSWWRRSIHRQLPRPFHWFDLVRESPIGDRWPYSGANDRVGSRIPTRRLPTPHALLVDFQHRGNLSTAGYADTGRALFDQVATFVAQIYPQVWQLTPLYESYRRGYSPIQVTTRDAALKTGGFYTREPFVATIHFS